MRLLYVVHNIPSLDSSGTPLRTWQYATQAIRNGDTVAIAFPLAAGGQVVSPVDGIELLPLPSTADWPLAAFSVPPRQDEAMLSILRPFRPDIVHIVDWVNLPSAVLATLRSLDVPVIRQICNFEDFCGFIEPIHFHPENRICQAPVTPAQCAECLVRKQNIRGNVDAPIDDIIAMLTEKRIAMKADFTRMVTTKHQAFQRHVQEFYDMLIFASSSFADYMNSMVDLRAIPQRVIAHGLTAARARSPTAPRRPGTPLRCVFLGPCGERKGWTVIERRFARLLPEAAGRLTLRVAGGRALAGRTPLTGLPGVELLDGFPPSALPAMLAGCDVGLVPSPFETFNRVCREMLAYGMPVIGSDAFGIPEAVADGVNGLIIGPPSVAGLTNAIRRLLDEDGLLATLTEGARATPLCSPEDEFAELTQLYRTMAPRR